MDEMTKSSGSMVWIRQGLRLSNRSINRQRMSVVYRLTALSQQVRYLIHSYTWCNSTQTQEEGFAQLQLPKGAPASADFNTWVERVSVSFCSTFNQDC